MSITKELSIEPPGGGVACGGDGGPGANAQE